MNSIPYVKNNVAKAIKNQLSWGHSMPKLPKSGNCWELAPEGET